MLRPRIFPTLLIDGNALIKTKNFQTPRYIGDPLNAARIFAVKGVDELALLDIYATDQHRVIDPLLVSRISEECGMPVSAGGGINTIDHIRNLLKAGAEKVIINSHAILHMDFLKKSSEYFGSSTIVVSIDVKKKRNGSYQVFTHGGRLPVKNKTLKDLLIEIEQNGAGELLINSINNDGVMEGFDTELIRSITDQVNIPVIACGGAGRLSDFSDVINVGHASAATAGSFFIYQGKRKAVLINFPTKSDIRELFINDSITK